MVTEGAYSEDNLLSSPFFHSTRYLNQVTVPKLQRGLLLGCVIFPNDCSRGQGKTVPLWRILHRIYCPYSVILLPLYKDARTYFITPLSDKEPR